MKNTQNIIGLNKDGNINSLEDRLWALANLISAEEHAFSSYLRTDDPVWYRRLIDLRDTRREVMISVLGANAMHNEAEIWCTFKHLLAGAMRLYEAGCRYMKEDTQRANKLFDDSHTLIGMALTLIEEVTMSAGSTPPKADKETTKNTIVTENTPLDEPYMNSLTAEKKADIPTNENKSSMKWTSRLKEILKCCIE